ncbi:hypothetical protein VTI74DRAFT_9615 [Chaetomium olivicolor]
MSPTMEAPVFRPSILEVIHKELGHVSFTDGPFKPISAGFVAFFEELFCVVSRSNADAIVSLAHLNIPAISHDSIKAHHEVAVFVEPEDSKVSTQPADKAGPTEAASKAADSAEATLNTTESPGVETIQIISAAEESTVIAEIPASSETILACAEVTVGPAERFTPTTTEVATVEQPVAEPTTVVEETAAETISESPAEDAPATEAYKISVTIAFPEEDTPTVAETIATEDACTENNEIAAKFNIPEDTTCDTLIDDTAKPSENALAIENEDGRCENTEGVTEDLAAPCASVIELVQQLEIDIARTEEQSPQDTTKNNTIPPRSAPDADIDEETVADVEGATTILVVDDAHAHTEVTIAEQVEVTENASASDEATHGTLSEPEIVQALKDTVEDNTHTLEHTLETTIKEPIEVASEPANEIMTENKSDAGLEDIIEEVLEHETVEHLLEEEPENGIEAHLANELGSVLKGVVSNILAEDDEDSEDENEYEPVELPDTKEAIHIEGSETEIAVGVTCTVPTLPVVFEDDFDAPVSTIFDIHFEHLMEIDATWCIPQIIEKGKSEREIVRERLANQSTTRFNLQNLRLEKAARALSIDGPVPVIATSKPATPIVETSNLATPIEPKEAGTPANALERKTTTALEAFPANEEAPIELAEEVVRNHSRSASTSSTASKTSVEQSTVFDSEPYPGTPVTEYSMTPSKKELSTLLKQAVINETAAITHQGSDLEVQPSIENDTPKDEDVPRN